jgi:hypothetical protein
MITATTPIDKTETTKKPTASKTNSKDTVGSTPPPSSRAILAIPD